MEGRRLGDLMGLFRRGALTLVVLLFLASLPAHGQPLPGAEPPGKPATIQAASRENPFVNTLGMKFVPVSMPGGPSRDHPVLFSVWDTRVQDYAAYASAKKVDDAWTKQQRDGVPAGREPNHPVVGVNWEEAQAFCLRIPVCPRCIRALGE